MNEISKLLTSQGVLNTGNLILSVLLSMTFGYILAQVYRVYYGRNEPADHSVGKSFPLIMPATTAIFIIIQYSLPLSLGLLGALSFVRFRTPVKRAEDIAFILLAIAISLSCAVQYYQIAVFLLIIVLTYSVLRNRFAIFDFFSSGHTLITLHNAVPIDASGVVAGLDDTFNKPTIISSQFADDYHSLVLSIDGQDSNKHMLLTNILEKQAGEGVRVDIFYPGNELSA